MADDFVDFMVTGGDELINGKDCPHCGKRINPEDIDKSDDKCPHCGNSGKNRVRKSSSTAQDSLYGYLTLFGFILTCVSFWGAAQPSFSIRAVYYFLFSGFLGILLLFYSFGRISKTTGSLIGKRLDDISDYHSNAMAEGYLRSDSKLSDGKASVILHEHGIMVTQSFHVIKILDSKIISIDETIGREQIGKNVIGRSVAGLALLGPLGAVVGAVSGVGSKDKKKFYLNIRYMDDLTKKETLLLLGGNSSYENFIKEFKESRN